MSEASGYSQSKINPFKIIVHNEIHDVGSEKLSISI